MPTNRKIAFANSYVYHVYNRGIERRPTFRDKREYNRMMDAVRFYQFLRPPIKLSHYLNLSREDKEYFLTSTQSSLSKQVEIISYCLMPNHFHFLLQQKEENGISKFIANVVNSYTKYFNLKEDRVGPLFQGIFKAVFIETIEQLIHVSRYIHLNPVTSSIIKPEELESYTWSSYPHYLDDEEECFVEKKLILDEFSSRDGYRNFVIDHISYAKELEKIKHLTLD